jgi:hypothetical protein
MPKVGPVIVSLVAILLGALLGLGGALLMLDAGSFFAAESSQDNGALGLFGGSSQEARMETPAWVGLLAAAVGAGLLLFGFRALYVSFEGRDVA